MLTKSSKPHKKYSLDAKRMKPLTERSFIRAQPRLILVSPEHKQLLLKHLMHDRAYSLHAFMETNSIRPEAELGLKGSRWNLIHFAAKLNAQQCLSFLLQKEYQSPTGNINALINSITSEGYTPCAVAIIHDSLGALDALVRCGGSDIQSKDHQNNTPYDHALRLQNIYALKLLSQKDFAELNKTFLAAQISFSMRNESCLSSCTHSLLNCLTFGLYSKIEAQKLSVKKITELFSFRSQVVQIVPIGDGDLDLDVQYAPLKSKDSKKPLLPLFSNFDSNKISELTSLGNHIAAVFKSLCGNSELLRQVIQVDILKQSEFSVRLWIRDTFIKIVVDWTVPVCKNSKQPAFVCSSIELWPSILQKALAKVHGSYTQLYKLSPLQIFQQITGSPTMLIDIPEDVSYLVKELKIQGYAILAEGKQGNWPLLKGKQQPYFTVAGSFEREGRRLVQLNCPPKPNNFGCDDLTVGSTADSLSIENAVDYSWFDQDEIGDLFNGLLVCLPLSGMTVSSKTFKSLSRVFLRFKINSDNLKPIMIQLRSTASGSYYNLNKDGTYNCFLNSNHNSTLLPALPGFPHIAAVQCCRGEYMICLQLSSEAEQCLSSMNLTIWSPEDPHLTLITNKTGAQQNWIDLVREQTIRKWQADDQYKLIPIGCLGRGLVVSQGAGQRALLKEEYSGKQYQMTRLKNEFFYQCLDSSTIKKISINYQ